MQDPDREKCKVCGKLLKKASMKKHLANVHGKAAQQKKQQAPLHAVTKEISINHNYAVPAEINDQKMQELAMILEDFEFIDVEPSEGYGSKPKRNQEEQKVQKKMEKKTGFTHMRCPAGIIDLFDPKGCQIIEIKHWKLFKYCIGQLLAYNYFYPKFMLRAHFFGQVPEDGTKLMIINICQSLRIHVTWEGQD
jgi:hypothetical protein